MTNVMTFQAGALDQSAPGLAKILHDHPIVEILVNDKPVLPQFRRYHAALFKNLPEPYRNPLLSRHQFYYDIRRQRSFDADMLTATAMGDIVVLNSRVNSQGRRRTRPNEDFLRVYIWNPDATHTVPDNPALRDYMARYDAALTMMQINLENAMDDIAVEESLHQIQMALNDLYEQRNELRGLLGQ